MSVPKTITVDIKRDVNLARYNVPGVRVSKTITLEPWDNEAKEFEALHNEVSEAVDFLVEKEIAEFKERSAAIKKQLSTTKQKKEKVEK